MRGGVIRTGHAVYSYERVALPADETAYEK
jgi:hypothetical protein